jgi:hypothetical protein
MSNANLGSAITTALCECDDTILSVAETLGEVLGMWVAEAAATVGVEPRELRAIIDRSTDAAIAEALAVPARLDS